MPLPTGDLRMRSDFGTLVDTDVGVDDTLALFVLMQIAPRSAIDVAVTFGNVPIDQALSNLGLLTAVSGLAPHRILSGSSAPISGDPDFATDVHGFDGLATLQSRPGGVRHQFSQPTISSKAQN
jgi:inosine-uridine nucleoside N-ribohydrolase